jgi:hypothetical protein
VPTPGISGSRRKQVDPGGCVRVLAAGSHEMEAGLHQATGLLRPELILLHDDVWTIPQDRTSAHRLPGSHRKYPTRMLQDRGRIGSTLRAYSQEPIDRIVVSNTSS